MDAWFRLESLEHYATILMYTGNIIGKANVLSCEQVQELVKIREKLGIQAGGLPPCCAAKASNLADVGGCASCSMVSGAKVHSTVQANPADIEAIVRSVQQKLNLQK